jgi:hypothetical protein
MALSLALAGLLGTLSQAAAQTPLGPQFRVDPGPFLSFVRYAPGVAFDPSGTLWIAWESHDESLNGVAARAVSPAGALRRTILPLPGTAQIPALVAAPGGFAVFGQTQEGLLVMRRFNRLGALRGPLVRAQPSEPLASYAVTPLPHGGFFLVWTADDCPGIRCASLGVFARVLDGLGRALTPAFRVTESALGDQHPTGVAADPDGNVWVTWWKTVPDALGYAVFARRFSRQGNALSSEIRVSERTPAVEGGTAGDAQGNFVVTWTAPPLDDAKQEIYARRFSRLGTPAGPEILVSAEPSSAAVRSQVAVSPAGDFFVVWTSLYCAQCDYVDIKGRLFRADGTVEDELLVDDDRVGIQDAARAAFGPDGRLAVAWISESTSHSDFEVDAKLYSVGTAPPP